MCFAVTLYEKNKNETLNTYGCVRCFRVLGGGDGEKEATWSEGDRKEDREGEVNCVRWRQNERKKRWKK